MHLVSRGGSASGWRRPNVDFVLDEGETIWTESSYKFEPNDVVRRLHDAGFEAVDQWVDEQDRFALTLARAV